MITITLKVLGFLLALSFATRALLFFPLPTQDNNWAINTYKEINAENADVPTYTQIKIDSALIYKQVLFWDIYHLFVILLGIISGALIYLRQHFRVYILLLSTACYIIWVEPYVFYESLIYTTDLANFLSQIYKLLGATKLNFELTVPLLICSIIALEVYVNISSNKVLKRDSEKSAEPLS